MLNVDKTFNRSARAGRRVLRGVAAIAIRSAVRPPLIAVATISLVALAQTPAPVPPVSTPAAAAGTALSGVFEPDDIIIRPDAIGKLQEAVKKAHRDCYPPRVKFTVVVPGGADPLYVKTLAEARQVALNAALPSLGLDAGQFKVDYVIGVVDGVLVSYDKFNEDDKDPPMLKVTWVPKKGTKVKAGDKIKVTIKASERYEDGHKSWPTGVYDIRLAAVHGGSEATVDFMDYGRPTQPCERRTFEATFIVPRNPLQIVHLKAIAEDGVGHPASEDGKFPTVEVWHGTIETFEDLTLTKSGDSHHYFERESVKFDLYETSKGKVEGQAHATWTASNEVVTGYCAGDKGFNDPKTVAWDPQLTGTVQHLPDGSTKISFQVTPERGPSYQHIQTGGGHCYGHSNTQENYNSWHAYKQWGGFEFLLKPGQDHQDHYDKHLDAALLAGWTGQKYHEIHVESTGK